MQTVKINYKDLIKNWYISYNQYSDLFQIYDDKVFTLPENKVSEKREKKFRIIISKDSAKPLLFEIKNAYDILGVDIGKLSKTSIIKLIEPYLKKYA